MFIWAALYHSPGICSNQSLQTLDSEQQKGILSRFWRPPSPQSRGWQGLASSQGSRGRCAPCLLQPLWWLSALLVVTSPRSLPCLHMALSSTLIFFF